MRATKRLLFVLAFPFFSAYAFGRWIATGDSALDMLVAFEHWRDA